MTRGEAINIKDEILRKEGSIHICNAITIDGVVLVKDILDIINKHMVESSDNKDKCCPSKEIVKEWRELNPLGRKIQCHIDTKLSRPTIDRYWDSVLQEE